MWIEHALIIGFNREKLVFKQRTVGFNKPNKRMQPARNPKCQVMPPSQVEASLVIFSDDHMPDDMTKAITWSWVENDVFSRRLCFVCISFRRPRSVWRRLRVKRKNVWLAVWSPAIWSWSQDFTLSSFGSHENSHRSNPKVVKKNARWPQGLPSALYKPNLACWMRLLCVGILYYA